MPTERKTSSATTGKSTGAGSSAFVCVEPIADLSSPPASSRCYELFIRTATDMRKGFDAPCGEVCRGMGCDPVRGEVFIFYN